MQDRHDALPPGTVLEGFRIERVLGDGGFGITYLGYDLDLRRNVAIKEFLPSSLAHRIGGSVRPMSESMRRDYEWGLGRFLDEARTLGQLHHPNIVRVLRRFDANGTAYMVMDYVDGESLFARIDRDGTLTEPEIAKFLYPLLDGLKAVHGAGFLHRDIKPGNIFIRRDGAPVLLDFGAARAAIGEATHTLTAILSEGYAPFEQYGEAGDQGAWTDIYALGATIYTCITGEKPPRAPARVKAVWEGKRDPLVSAAERGRGVYSKRFLAAVDRALSIPEKERPQSAAAMLKLLGDPPTPPITQEISETHGGKKGTETIAPPPPRPPHRGWIFAVVLAAIAGIGYVIYDRIEAERIERQRIEAQKLEAERLIAQAREAIKAGRLDDAGRLLTRAAALDPRAQALATARQELAAAIRARDEAEAERKRIAALQRTCAAEFDSRVARMQACTTLIDGGSVSGEALAAAYAGRCHVKLAYYYRGERAIADCDQALRLAPRMALAFAYRALVQSELEKTALANEDLRTALALAPNLVRALTIQCSFLNSDKKYNDALTACQRALQLDPLNYAARLNRGTVYTNLKRHDEALADFDYAARRAPERGDAYRRRGLHHMVQKSDYARALADFDRAIRAEPNLGYGYRLKGLLLWHYKRYDDAYRTFAIGIERDVYFAGAIYSRATMSEELGRKTEAIADFRKTLARNPRHQAARDALTRLGARP